MTPLLATALIAFGAAAATYRAVVAAQRRTGRPSGVDAEDAGESARQAPSRALGATAVLAMLVVAGAVLGVLARSVERETAIVRWDERVERWASESAGTVDIAILRAMTHLGDTVVVLGLAGAAVVLLLAVGRRRLALFVAVVVLGQWALANLIKELVGRARPDLDPLAAFSGFSFPSGHATAAAATYLALALVVVAVRPGWNPPLVIAFGVGVAVAVAASRAILGVHWFSDVVGGLVLGWTWCLACAWLFRLAPPQDR